MKVWILPLMVGAGALGFLLGWISKRDTPDVHISGSRPSGSQVMPPASAIPSPLGESAPAPAAARADSPTVHPSPTTAKGKLVKRLSSFLDEGTLYHALWNLAASKKPQFRREVFRVLMESDDTEVMEHCSRLLGRIDSDDLMKDVLAAFQTETHTDRRYALAAILGANWKREDVRPAIVSALEGADAAIQAGMLSRMSLQQRFFVAGQEGYAQWAERFRLLASTGSTASLRAAAAGAMRGVNTKEGVRFLIDLMKRDPDPEVQYRALSSFPCNYRSPSPVIDEQVRAMYEAAIDEGRSDRLRKAAADRALSEAAPPGGIPKLLTEQEIATLRSILNPE